MGATGIVAIFLQAKFISKVNSRDWWFAFKLTMIGNLIQPWCLFTAVLYAGVPIGATFFGLVPVLVAIIANHRDRLNGKPYLPFKQLILPLSLILLGLCFANLEGLLESLKSATDTTNFVIGTIFAIASTAAWTWYPIRNADWLLEHQAISPIFFASMQSFILFPVGIVLYLLLYSYEPLARGILGPYPLAFSGWMLFAGVACSFGATALWNAMSQRVPTALVGQMLVFETIFSVVWGHIYEWQLPKMTMIIGMTLLVSGIVFALRLFNSLERSGVETPVG